MTPEPGTLILIPAEQDISHTASRTLPGRALSAAVRLLVLPLILSLLLAILLAN
jgi:hypothetical protein